MTAGFWQNLEKPIIGLAPMDGVTDAAFRYIMAKHGKPDVIITEFTAAEGIRAGAERLLDDFLYDPLERPVVAQLFGSDPEAFFIAAVVAAALGFDGIDINMGCPAKNITERGAGAGLIADPPRAKQIIQRVRDGIQAWVEHGQLVELGVPENIAAKVWERRSGYGLNREDRRDLPVTVKTRIGISTTTVTDWVQHLLEKEPVAITIHGRTLKQLYTGLADWEAIGAAAAIIKQTPTLVLGNGDIQSKADARARCTQYNLDGALVGRACFGNPWLFQEREATWEERLRTALEHARYLHTALEGRGFLRIRKHLLDYTKAFPSAKELRLELMRVTTLEDVERILGPVVSPDTI